ncbi:hypothetical protein PIIN_06820 [Serendipita indica DSM 11827]|uniref:F-box domain-containing protein n=1 Tax=Serendipita indica (strain DSM 11827) TaxID=1109443 RepID=G4TNJ6_SERID|nr:hypothetical protein PIIN_06820 [Serendipita indica DSM 11827]
MEHPSMLLVAQNLLTRPRRARAANSASSTITTSSRLSAFSGSSVSSMGFLITTSQQASPSPSVHPLEVALDRTTIFTAPQIGLHTRTSLAIPRPVTRRHRSSRMAPESAVSSLLRGSTNRFSSMVADFSRPEGRDEQIDTIVSVVQVPNIHSKHANTLSRDILQRIFDFYANNLRRDASRSPFATLETLLHVCRHWKKVAEGYEHMWAKVYVTLTNKQDVGK